MGFERLRPKTLAAVTAIIPTYNEEAHIEAAIRSVSWADEVLVVDSFSTDRTLELARPLATRILQREYENSASQKNWAIPQAAHPWIFLLDADERCTPELEAEVKATLAAGPQHDAYWIYRRNHFMGQPIRYCGWQSDAVVRLFRRDTCRYEAKHVHAEIIAEGSIGRLKQRLLHYTYRDLPTYLRKADRYTNWGAHDRAANVKRITAYHLIAKPLARFCKQYFLKLGFLDGRYGLMLCMLSAYTLFIRALKIDRLHAGETLPDRR